MKTRKPTTPRHTATHHTNSEKYKLCRGVSWRVVGFLGRALFVVCRGCVATTFPLRHIPLAVIRASFLKVSWCVVACRGFFFGAQSSIFVAEHFGHGADEQQ